MGLESLVIVLDNPKPTLVVSKKESTVVTGRVVLVSSEDHHIQGLRLDFKGKAKVEWTTQKDGVRAGNCSSQETYFYTRNYLVGDGKEAKVLLSIGEHSYPFRLTFPAGLPSSFKETYGRITYKVEAVVERAWKLDVKTRKDLAVVAPVELNTSSEYTVPVKFKVTEHYGFLLSRFALTMTLRLTARNIVPGQKYPVTVDVKNDSNVDVHEVIGKVKKYTTFRLSPPSTKTKITRKVLCSFKLTAPERKSAKSSTVLLPALNEPALNVDSCRIIDVDYMLIIKAVTLGLHKNAKVKCRVNVVSSS